MSGSYVEKTDHPHAPIPTHSLGLWMLHKSEILQAKSDKKLNISAFAPSFFRLVITAIELSPPLW